MGSTCNSPIGQCFKTSITHFFTVMQSLPYVLQQHSLASAQASSEFQPEAARNKARQKASDILAVAKAIVSTSDSYHVGSRRPTSDPIWITPVVAQGGFAVPGASKASITNDVNSNNGHCHYETLYGASNESCLDEEGDAFHCLSNMLDSGEYTVECAEHAAIPVILYLRSIGKTAKAAKILSEITPYFDRIRFYSMPSLATTTTDEKVPHEALVYQHTVSEAKEKIGAFVETRDSMSNRRTRTMMGRRNAYAIWRPLKSQLVELFAKTRSGSSDWPCQKFDSDWAQEASKLLQEYKAYVDADAKEAKLASKSYLGAKYVVKQGSSLRVYPTELLSSREGRFLPNSKHFAPRSALGHLLKCLEACAVGNSHALTGRDVGLLRQMCVSHERKYGGVADAEPSSRYHVYFTAAHAQFEKHKATLATASGLLETKLSHMPLNGPITTPINGLPDAKLQSLVDRCTAMPLKTLLDKGIIASPTDLAKVLPQLGSACLDISDMKYRRLMLATFRAFQTRQSLLLLNLQSQVRFEELPWVGKLPKDRARAGTVMSQIFDTVLSQFPHLLMSNELLDGLGSIARDSEVLLLKELAADIFMGRFSGAFPKVAAVSASLLRGSLYEKYFGLQEIFGSIAAESRGGISSESRFGKHCKSLKRQYLEANGLPVGGRGDYSITGHRQLIEAQQIITTQNLSEVFVKVDVAMDSASLLAKAKQCFSFCTKQLCIHQACFRKQQRLGVLRSRRLAANAWRNMIFFISLCTHDDDSVKHFINEDMSQVLNSTTRRVSGLAFHLEHCLVGPLRRLWNGDEKRVQKPFTAWTPGGKHFVLMEVS